jgi:hypothetical protein
MSAGLPERLRFKRVLRSGNANMKVTLLCLLLVWTSALAAQTPAISSDPPAASGIYFRQGKSGWITLARAAIADTRTQGMERFLDTHGWSNLSRTIVFRGATSSVRIPDRKPTFYVRGIGSAGDVLIAELKKKADTREIQASSTDASVNNKEGFKRGSIYRVTAVPLARDFYTVTPEEDLKPGEYLLVFGHAYNAFDFSILSGAR